jgi:short-subunit dehydrogenase involved in D-alanine esterification of teichoic acids
VSDPSLPFAPLQPNHLTIASADLMRLPGDVGSKQSVDELVTALQTLEEYIDVLINCAGRH